MAIIIVNRPKCLTGRWNRGLLLAVISVVSCGGNQNATRGDQSSAVGGTGDDPADAGGNGGASTHRGTDATGGLQHGGALNGQAGAVPSVANGGVEAKTIPSLGGAGGVNSSTGGVEADAPGGSPSTSRSAGTAGHDWIGNAGGLALSHAGATENPSTAGTATGGTATGGIATGGTATGGIATGGTATGGTATGGTATGGTATGGTATGGTATGGTATGGTATGGTATGGTATGGTATGGTATGGTTSSCNPPCSGGHASWSCNSGQCAIQECDEGWDDCSEIEPGCEKDVSSDPQNCGRCDNICDSGACLQNHCGVTQRISNTGPGMGHFNFSKNFLVGLRIKVEAESVLTGIGVVLNPNTSSIQMYLGVYRDNNNGPGAWIAGGQAPLTVSGGGTETSVSPATLAKGNYYWILAVADDTVSFAYNSTATQTGNFRYISYTFQPLPTQAPAAMSIPNSQDPNLYLIVAQ